MWKGRERTSFNKANIKYSTNQAGAIHVMFKMEDGTEDNERTSLLRYRRDTTASPNSVSDDLIGYSEYMVTFNNLSRLML